MHTPISMDAGRPPLNSPQSGFALWNLGFRPFFLCAGLFALISISLWMAQLAGWLGARVYLAGPLWHAHEMIFGYTFAVVVGFLFTAVRNWTAHSTPRGLPLVIIAALWAGARMFVALGWLLPAAIADAAFALLAAIGIAVPLYKGRNLRNAVFVALVLALGAASFVFYLAMGKMVDVAIERDLQFGLHLILLIITVIGGRVIPMFTAGAVKGASPRRNPWIERAAVGSVLALVVADLLGPPPFVSAAIAGIAAVSHAARLVLWKPWVARAAPILWILHASYAWIVVYLVLQSLAAMGAISESIAAHALTVGVIGGLTIGMMTRVARGHTGRPLQASTAETTSYVLIQFAAAVRVFLPILIPQLYLATIIVSGTLWSVAFFLFTATFWPILTRPRIDGESG
jgi:uncharacterized protein involved in response to NO